MNNKENLTNEISDIAIEDNLDELKEIADYYKDIEYTDEKPIEIPKRTIISDPEAYVNEGYTPAITKRKYKGNLIFDIAFVASSLIVSLIVMIIAFQIGASGVKPENLVEEKYHEILAGSSKYNDLVRQISATNTEIEDLTHDRDLKQAEYDALIAYRDSQASVETQITELQTQLDTLNAENQSKQEEIDSLTDDIAEKIATIQNLTPGVYTVGESITAGKYIITGSGKILISNSGGSVKLNTILTAEGVTVTLDDADKIQLDTRAKFSPTI